MFSPRRVYRDTALTASEGGFGLRAEEGGDRSERIPNSIKWKWQQELGTVTGTGLKCDLGMTAVCVPPLCEIQEGPGGGSGGSGGGNLSRDSSVGRRLDVGDVKM